MKYISLIPGILDYYNALKNGKIKDELAHLYWLAAERSVEEDIDHPDFPKVADQTTKGEMRHAYNVINNIVESNVYNYSVF